MNEINQLCNDIETALTKAEDDINDVNGYGFLLAYTNYMYNIGRYHAYMDMLDIIDSGKWSDLVDAHAERIDRLENRAETVYQNLKAAIYGNIYA